MTRHDPKTNASISALIMALCASGAGAAMAANAEPASSVAPDDGSVGLEEIVVTATKRETNLQETPIAISVIAPEAMQDRHVQSLIDLADGAIPSLRVATFEARTSALTVGIRGIVPYDANQTARDQGVGVYIDGVYLGRQQGLNAALLDIERIEVLRGPQGTLFGRNTEGGAVSIVTKKPTGEFGGRVNVGTGNFGSHNEELHLNLPEVASVAVKVDALTQHQNATVTNPLPGNYGWDYFNRHGERITALWKPVEGFKAEVSFDKARDENTPRFSQLINYNPLGKTVGIYDSVTNRLVAPGSPAGTNTTCSTCIAPLSSLVFVSGDKRQNASEIGVPQQPSVDETRGFSANLSWQISPDLLLRSITAIRSVTTEQWDNSGGGHRTIFAPNANFARYSLSKLKQDQTTQEFQLVGSYNELEYVAGAYYFTEDAREWAATPSTNKWNATGTGYTINSPVVIGAVTSGNQGWDPAAWFVQRDSNATAKSYAAYFQGTWSPTKTVHLTAGGRYTKDKRDGALTMVSAVRTNYPFTFDKGRFDPLVTVGWDAADGVNLYAKYSTGYRAGGANDRSSNFAAFGEEAVRAYEVGAKMDLLDRKVRLNVAAYAMDRTGTQIDFDHVDTNPTLPGTTTPNPTFNLHTQDTANAPGKSTIRGFEAELTVRPTAALTLGASYAYTKAEIPLTPNPQLPGNPLTQVFVVFTPKSALSGNVDYDVALTNGRLRFHLDGNYAGAMYTFQDENVLTDSSLVFNGRISLGNLKLSPQGQTLTVGLWSRNLLDEAHIYRRSNANNGSLGAYGNFNPPRTFGIDATVNF